jgi:16S rRNA (cytosine967-C5)-methyltransferase
MAVSPARAAAFDVLLRIEQESSYATDLLHSAQFNLLSSQDHGLATELVMGVLRWRSLLDSQIAAASNLALQKIDIEVLSALRMAAYQLLFLDRVPGRAAVNESVELVKRSHKRSAIPFANAVLRKLSLRLPEFKTDFQSVRAETVLQQADHWSHPLWLVERWSHEYGLAVSNDICEYDQKIPETSIHISGENAEKQLKEHGIELAPGKLLASARRVISGDVTRTAPFLEGAVSIQDEASQLVGLLAGHASTILDCCAAPGGKTRILAEQNPQGRILAVDLHPHRARLLRKLVPAKNVSVIASDTRHLATNGLFELVVVDAPCSGTGTLARNPEIKWKLRNEDIADLAARQSAILRSAMDRVAPGGRLVYATCSLEREENSDVVEKALESDNAFCALDCLDILRRLRAGGTLALETEVDLLTAGNYLRILPGMLPCDGFFAAVLQKRN